MSTILKFKCPDCGNEKLIMAQSVVKGYPVMVITEYDGGGCSVDTGEEIDIDTNNVDEVVSYSCTDCGNILVMEDDMPVIEDNELAEWVKKNCKQE